MIRLAVVIGPNETALLTKEHLGYHLAEAPWLLESPDLFKFYRRLVDKGCHVILDNGAGLGAHVEAEAFKNLYYALRPTEVVVPDVMGDMVKTLEMWQANEGWIPERSRFGVPHGTTLREWMNCFSFMKKWGVRTIGIAKRYELEFPGGRAAILREIADYVSDVDVHMLGLWMDFHSVREEVASWQGYFHLIRGLDTSAPTAFAQAGINLQEYRSKMHMTPESASDPDLFRDNVEYLLEVLHLAY